MILRIRVNDGEDKVYSIYEVNLGWRKDNKFAGHTQYAMNNAMIDLASCPGGTITITEC